MEQSLEDLDDIDALQKEIEISLGKGNLILCTVRSPAYRNKIIQLLGESFSLNVERVVEGDPLIAALREIEIKGVDVLIWKLPERLGPSLIEALNNFRELFYETGIPNVVFLTPSALGDLIRQAPDFWRYRGGFHELQEDEGKMAFLALEGVAAPFSFKDKEDLQRRKKINSYMLEVTRDPKNRLNALIELGQIHFFLSEYAKSLSFSQEALEIARKIGDRRSEGNALGNLGLAYAALGDQRKAIEHYNQALLISREIGDRRGEGNALGNLGLAYADLGDARKAIEHYDQALLISREIGDRRGKGAWLGNLGQIGRAHV